MEYIAGLIYLRPGNASQPDELCDISRMIHYGTDEGFGNFLSISNGFNTKGKHSFKPQKETTN